jgi:hypothetical protein
MKELYAGKLNGENEHSVISKEHNVEVIWRLGDNWKKGVNSYSTVIIRDIDETDQYIQITVHDIKKIKLTNLLLSGLGIKIVIKKPRFRAKYEREYWYVTDTGMIRNEIDKDNHFDIDRWMCGNYFKTEEDAENSEIFKSYYSGIKKEKKVDYYCHSCKSHFSESEDVIHPLCHFCDSTKTERF